MKAHLYEHISQHKKAGGSVPRRVLEAQLCSLLLPALTGDCRAQTAPCSPPGPPVRPWCCGGSPGLFAALSLRGCRVGARGAGGALVLGKRSVAVCRRFLVGSLFGGVGGIFYFCPSPSPSGSNCPPPFLEGKFLSRAVCPGWDGHSAAPHMGGSIPHGNNPTRSGPAHPLT